MIYNYFLPIIIGAPLGEILWASAATSCISIVAKVAFNSTKELKGIENI